MTDLERALDALAQHGATIRPHQVDAVIKALTAARREGAEAALKELEDTLRREIAIGRREGAEAEREAWMSCATADGLAVKALTIARSKGAEEMRERLLSSLSYPNRSALREKVRENLEQQYANIFGKRCSTDTCRRLAECALETTVDFLRADVPK